MGTRLGHVVYGMSFCLIGLWHLINNSKLHARNPKSFTSHAWFPTSRIRYLELWFLMTFCAASMGLEVFFASTRDYRPTNPDGSIPPTHLSNFEHSIIALAIFMYAALALLLDRVDPPAKHGLTNMALSVMYGLELLTFHFHSTDHMGVEGRYHWHLQILVLVCLSTSVLVINYPDGFLISFVRSGAVLAQGVWLINIGIMLGTPGLIPEGCFVNPEHQRLVVRCSGEEALERARSLVTIQFSYCVVGLCVLAVTMYLLLFKVYYSPNLLPIHYQPVASVLEDVEADEKKGLKSFAPMEVAM